MKRGNKPLLLVFIQFACIIYIAFSGPGFPSNIILLSLEILLLSLGAWAIWEMKFRFNIFPELLENKSLVTSGPYKFVRHPMYTTIIFLSLLLVINEFSILRCIVWIILSVVLQIKIQMEENILDEKFAQYATYKNRTKKIIPFIY